MTLAKFLESSSASFEAISQPLNDHSCTGHPGEPNEGKRYRPECCRTGGNIPDEVYQLPACVASRVLFVSDSHGGEKRRYPDIMRCS